MTQLARRDLEWIVHYTRGYQTLLDVGCGQGHLLQYLKEHGAIEASGIEIDPQKVSHALINGLSVIQGDIDEELAFYPDNGFDVVVAANSLQMSKDASKVLDQMLRIGKKVIISIPNFGHIRNRLQLAVQGRMPMSKSLPYHWYDTPNIHFCTVQDGCRLAQALGATVIDRHFLKNNQSDLPLLLSPLANLLSQTAILVLER